jgi:osmoprotectant transport system permease protein
MQTFLQSFRFMSDNLGLLAHKTLELLALSGAAIGISLLVALPLGLWLGHLHRGSFVAINVANIGRALPSLAVIAIGIGLLGLGFLNVMVALVMLAVPPLLTNAYVAIDGVDPDAVQAARGMGMSARQLFARVELPLGLPLVFAGVRTAAVYVVATATLAAIAGGGGLGDIIVNQASYRFPGVVAAAIWVAALAILVDLALGLAQRLATPRGLREPAPRLGPSPAAAPSGRPASPVRAPGQGKPPAAGNLKGPA